MSFDTLPEAVFSTTPVPDPMVASAAEWSRTVANALEWARAADSQAVGGDGVSYVPELLRAVAASHRALVRVIQAQANGQFLAREREAQQALCWNVSSRITGFDQQLTRLADRMEATADERQGQEREAYIANGGLP